MTKQEQEKEQELQKILWETIKMLQSLDRDAQVRIIRTVAVFFGLHLL